MLKKILSIPRSILFNLIHLPFKQAIKMPICVSYNICTNIKGKIIINAPIRSQMIRIGFHECDTCNINDQTTLKVGKCAKLIFNGSAHIGNGSKIICNGTLNLGDNFAISASSTIKCYEKIFFGNDIQFSWNCLVMDSDSHSIYDKNGEVCNSNKEIILGNNIWIGCNCTILKGSVIPNNCVLGACSLVTGANFSENSIIAGSPAKSIKTIGGFKI